MKVEEALKIQTEIKLLEAGMYDEEVYDYINGDGNDQYMKDFELIMFVRTGPHSRSTTGKIPDNTANRVWWFRRKLHPELFENKPGCKLTHKDIQL